MKRYRKMVKGACSLFQTQEIYVMLLFPNCLQLYDEPHDAEGCSDHHCTDACIMLEEFCIFATELARLCERG